MALLDRFCKRVSASVQSDVIYQWRAIYSFIHSFIYNQEIAILLADNCHQNSWQQNSLYLGKYLDKLLEDEE